MKMVEDRQISSKQDRWIYQLKKWKMRKKSSSIPQVIDVYTCAHFNSIIA